MSPITVLNGTLDAIPADLLDAHLRHARKGNRLVILDHSNDLVKAHFARGDAHIDTFSGNYDLLADHRDESQCAAAAEEIVGFLFEKSVAVPAKKIIAAILLKHASRYGSIEDVVADMRACGHEQVRKHMAIVPSDDAAAAKLTWSIMSTLRDRAEAFLERDPHARSISTKEWENSEKSSILFVSHYRFSLPLSRALRRKILQGPYPGCHTAEIVFMGGSEETEDAYEVQLDLGLPGPPMRDLVIDLYDDRDIYPAASSAEIVPFSRPATPPPAVTASLPGSVGTEDQPEPALSRHDDPEQLIDNPETDAADQPTVDSERPARRLINELAFGLLLVGVGFAGGITISDKEPSAAELHWMALSEQRLAAVEAVTTRSMRASERSDVKGVAFEPPLLPAASGTSHVSR